MDRRFFVNLLATGVLAVGMTACGSDDATSTAAESSAAQPTGSPAAPSSASPVTTAPLVVTEFAGGATYVTGHLEDFVMEVGILETDADGVGHSRDGTVGYRLVTGDPRVTGTVEGTWNSDRWGSLYDGAMTQWGTATLTNENGTWEGDYAGGFASPVGDIITRWWRGSGDYEGLTFYMWTAGSEPGVAEFDIGGIVFPSDPPPTVTS